ncbi:MAG: NAD(P)-dependent alcohol dehydrogenase [Gammaproteobacteria bacterium]|nr:NAD(P)-dependent alcohol dehydrogenase [Gammaproteobacteria bacterium]
MNAWQITSAGGIDALSATTRPVEQPAHGQILVRARAVSLNYRDLLHVLGYADQDRWPLVPCSDGAGDVVAVGAGVTRFKVGDKVAGTFFQRWVSGNVSPAVMESALGGRQQGMLAEHVILSEEGAVAIPAGWSYAQASTLPCAALTAWHALVTKGRVRAGETVLVLGTGGVSLFALQIAKMHGARVILTSSSDDKLARARAMGADETINYRQFSDWEQRVLELTGGLGVDHVVEVGGAGTFEKSCASARFGGNVWLIGVLTGFESTINPISVLFKSLSVQGIYVGSRDMFDAMNAAFSANELKPVIDREFAFAEAPAAFHYMQAAGHFGKIIVEQM